MSEIKSVKEIIEEISPYYKKKGEPESEHLLAYESFKESLEPVYYFLLELMNDFGFKTEKLIDNFSPAPGSAQWQEIGQKKGMMQEQASKIMANIGVITRGVLTNIYDLRDFKMRLQNYEDLKSKDKDKSQAAELTLKQIWMDKVDIQKGNSSIKGLALGQGGFQTLLDAFLVVKNESLKDSKGNEIDLNDRVKRILKPRIQEFKIWLEHSGKELKKRYELQRSYLKSQVNNLKLYSRWVKPYLKQAFELETKDQGKNPNFVKSFNRTILELTILGKNPLDVKAESIAGDLPEDFQKDKFLRSLKREYHSCVLIDFNFITVPGQVYVGKVEVNFRAYALNEDELKKLEQELDESDLGDALKLIQGTTDESLEQMQDEINEFLEEKTEKEKDKIKEKKKSTDKSNPFLALIGSYKEKEEKPKEKTDEKEKKEIIVKPDNWIEENHLRKLSAEDAKKKAFNLFDVYKKVHGMASFT